MINQFTSYFGFCSKLSKISLNSINPVGKFVAYGYYFPKDWTQDYIYSQLDPSRKKIVHIKLIPNRLGQSSGKVLFEFQSENYMKQYIDKYNEDFIITKQSANRIIIKPFSLKTLQKKSQVEEKRTKHAVKIKNLDFDITKDQLQRLAQDYGSVQFIEMNLKPNGLNSGMATIFFSKSKEATDFAYFCDLLVYRDRKLSTQVINFHKQKNINEIKYLQYPKITMQANDRIYKLKIVQQAKKQQKKQ